MKKIILIIAAILLLPALANAQARYTCSTILNGCCYINSPLILGTFTLVGDIDTTTYALDWDVIDNNAASMCFEATGAAGIMCIDSTNAAEGVPVSGYISATGDISAGSMTMVNTVNEFSTDGTLAGDSDTALPTEKAVKTYVDATAAAQDEFIELTDTPVGYTTANVLYTTNGTPDALIETTVAMTEAANNYNFTKGTAILDINSATVDIDENLTVSAACVLDQDLQQTASPTFNAVTGTSFVVGANTLDTTEFAHLDGQDQAVATTDDVGFNSMTLAAGLTLTGGDTITTTANGYLRLNPHGTGFTIIGSSVPGVFPKLTPDGNDVAISGSVQILGVVYTEDMRIADNGYIMVGSAGDLRFAHHNAWATNYMLLNADGGRHLVVGTYENRANDINFPAQDNPTVAMTSIADWDDTTSEIFYFAHTGADAQFTNGLGGFIWGIDDQPARGTMTLTGQPAALETFDIAGTVFTEGTEWSIGGDTAATVTNIIAAINASAVNCHAYAGAGTTIIIEWLVAGVAGNAIVFTAAMTNTAVDGAGTLGGTHAGVAADASLMSLDENGNFSVDGSYTCVGADLGAGALTINAIEVVGADGEVNAAAIEDKFLRNDGDDSTTGAITSTGFTIGANALTTTEWAFLDGQNQSVATGDSPSFTAATLGTGGLTVGAGADANMTLITVDRNAVDANCSWDETDDQFTFSHTVGVTGDVSGTTTGGITTGNLVDKSAGESVSGAWSFTSGGLQMPNGTDLPASCTGYGELFLDTDDDSCADAGGGDGCVCVCKNSAWVILVNF